MSDDEDDTTECPDCKGNGVLDGEQCPTCDGFGYLEDA